MLTFAVVFIFTARLTFTVEPMSLTYKNLEVYNVTCPPADTCKDWEPSISLNSHSCECKPSCARRRNCCIDSPYMSFSEIHTLEECTMVWKIYTSIFMVSKCDTDWNGPKRMAELCTRGYDSFNDPIVVIPVTNSFSGVSYANIFCAMCNNEVSGAVFWDFKVSRSTERDPFVCPGVAPRPLVYSNGDNSAHFVAWAWGYWAETSLNRIEFIHVDIQINIPNEIKTLISVCDGDTMSQCAEDWKDEEVRRQCSSYMALLEVCHMIEYERYEYIADHKSSAEDNKKSDEDNKNSDEDNKSSDEDHENSDEDDEIGDEDQKNSDEDHISSDENDNDDDKDDIGDDDDIEHLLSKVPENHDIYGDQENVTSAYASTTLESSLTENDYVYQDNVRMATVMDYHHTCKTYKNVHCAICNHVQNFNDTKCQIIKELGSSSPSSHGVNYLYPHQLPDKECLSAFTKSGDVTFLYRCRTVVCYPGYEIRRRKCVLMQ